MRVFVYGTLTDPATASEVLDSFVYTGPAVLEGLHAVAGRHPTLAPGGRVGGRILRTREVATLDAYEGFDRGLYVRVGVPVVTDADADATHDDGDADVAGANDPATDTDAPGVGTPSADGSSDDRVAVYVGDPDVLDADATWPGEGTFRERVERYVADRDVRARLDPE